MAVPSIPFTGFGTAFFDYDNDGWLDIVAANGAVHADRGAARARRPVPAAPEEAALPQPRQRPLRGDRPRPAGRRSQLSEVGRGLAVGDLDNDGAIDFVVNNNNGPLRIFLNAAARRSRGSACAR